MAVADIITKGFSGNPHYIVTKGFGVFVEAGPPTDSGWIAATRNRTWIAKCCETGANRAMYCVEARNVVCKHIEASDTYYVDFGPILEASETISSITTVTAADSALTVTAETVLSQNTSVNDEYGQAITIEANTGISFALSGGTANNGVSVITVKIAKSTGKTDAIDLLIDVLGTDV